MSSEVIETLALEIFQGLKFVLLHEPEQFVAHAFDHVITELHHSGAYLGSITA